MKDQPFHRGIFRLIGAVGIWTSGCLVLSVLVLAAVYLRVGTVNTTESVDIVARSSRQQMLIERLAKNALEIKVAINTNDWETVEPVLSQIISDHRQWRDAHESLSIAPQNSYSEDGGAHTIQAYFDRISYTQSQISHAINEIELLSHSIIRRAPYIDQATTDRITIATDLIIEHEPAYLESMNKIVSLYVLDAAKNAEHATGAIRKSLWLLLATLTLAFLIGVAPRYWLLVAQVARLQASLTRAHDAASARWHFLASLGHEFRTPTISIMNMAGLLASEDQDKATKEEHANEILRSGRGLMSLIEDIIDMSAIEAERLEVSLTETDPRKVIEELASTFTPLAQDKGLEFITFIDSTCPASITTDDKRLKQIISKIVGNAVKFTQTGSVELHAALEEVNGKDMFVIRVVDTGIGVDFKDASRIFEPFERVENEVDREYDGAGLGLTVAHAFASQLGGGITIETAKGAGSFVTISVDPGQYTVQSGSDPVTAKKDIVVDQKRLESKLVLLIEDGEDNRRLISGYLTKAGCIIQLAENGQVGIDRYMAAKDSKQPIDLILMDMQMPVMDGFEAISILRQKGANIPIIAHSLEDDRTRCLDAGCDEYLSTPVQRSLLLDTCALWISKHEAGEPHISQPPQAA